MTKCLTRYGSFYRLISFYACNNQHRFTKGLSVNTNLVQLTNIAMDTINIGFQLEVIYTDFSKAFDQVHPTYLLRRLSQTGIHSSLFNLLQSYLNSLYRVNPIFFKYSHFLEHIAGITILFCHHMNSVATCCQLGV